MRTELHFEDGWKPQLAAIGLDSFDAMMRSESGHCMSYHTRGQTYRIELADGQKIFLKRDAYTSAKDMLVDLLYLNKPQPPCLVEFRALKRVRALGIPVPEVVVWGQRRRWGLPCEGLLIMRELAGKALSEILQKIPSGPTRTEILRKVGLVAAKLYRARLCWPDLAPKHFFVQEDGLIGVLDLARLRHDCRPRSLYMSKQISRFCRKLLARGGTEAEVEAFRKSLRVNR